MNLGLLLSTLFFLYLLFDYQRKEKIYIGYTTVLTLLFVGTLIINFFSHLFWGESDAIIVFIFLILGSLLIYITSQLTLAFEKIQTLSQHIAIMELKNKTSTEKETIE